MKRWCAVANFAAGINSTNARSVCNGDFESVVKPNRSATRKTCVSTAIASAPNNTDVITFAVFRPTPGNATNSAAVRGTAPPCFSTNIFAIPLKCCAFEFGYETDFINAKISSTLACAISCAVGKAANNAGVTAFIRLSVHCAESITATKSSNSEE